MLDWEEGDRFSFDDSDRFEEDSLCSWSSEPESLCNNWRGWKKPAASSGSYFAGGKKSADEHPSVPSLTELSARCVASHIPFELVEHFYPPVPEQLQLRIAFWSFPDNEEDIRLYSCLANGAADEFARGENLHRNHMVKDPLQIGFHLSASVQQSLRGTHNVAVTFDRRRISSCNCTCSSTAYWCSHVVAVCLTRIHWPHLVTLRAPVSESLSRLHREQLQKFAQYLISELPQQILPTAQRLLDELLGSQPSAINSVCGAPDPTAGASANDQTSWYLDEKALHDNIKKILIKFCVPAPIVFSDVNYLSTVAPPAAAEWTSLLRPLRGREPEGMWNLLSIVREMFKRNDRNAIPLLEIITEECMACEQILIWWFNTKVALLNGNSAYGNNGGGKHNNVNSNTHASQHACSSLCDEVVVLWRLAALNPGLSPNERDMLHNQFTTWHMKILEKISKCRNNTTTQTTTTNSNNKNNNTLKIDLEVFTGFKPAIEACYLDWDDYQMPGITYNQDINPMYHCPFTCFRHNSEQIATTQTTTTTTSTQLNKAVTTCESSSSSSHLHHHHHYHHHHHNRVTRFDFVSVMSLNPAEYPPHPQLSTTGNNPANTGGNNRDGNRSSVSSEGFCENDDDINVIRNTNQNAGNKFDSDSQEGGGSDSSSNSSNCLDNTVNSPKTVENSKQPQQQQQKQQQRQQQQKTSDLNVASTSKIGIWTNTRRLSKDESTSSSNSESPQSCDEYNLYFYNSKDQLVYDNQQQQQQKDLKDDNEKVSTSSSVMLSNIRKSDDPWDVLFARAEGLHAHGHNKEACILGIKLAEELLANPPDLMIEIPPVPKRKGKKQQLNPASHQLSCLASGTLGKCAFLCSVLAENPEYYHLAFRVGMFGLEMARPPASTKPLEVKLANQEADLVNLLKRIPLGNKELKILRERADLLKNGILKSRGEAMLPVMLASFIFDALVIPNVTGRDRAKIINMRLPTDELLGFEAAVAALGLKANVSEADHPLLCEGTRRQRGDLAISLLTFYKDDCWKVARIMDRLLDREIHQLIKSPIISSYYSSNPPIKSQYSNLKREDCDKVMTPINAFVPPTELSTDLNGGSRPHSSTSAELEQGLAALNLGNNSTNNNIAASTSSSVTQQQQQVTTRTKESRYKGKRAYPSIPNQPSEAGAHFMFELAKIVLNKAGGSSSTSLFTQASTSQNHHGPHRALHMCAFQLGLYALGLHNCVSPNWLSRTYSSHVSWITGQATEIGAAAISFLIDTWEGHLTPPEAASIADRASRGCDPNIVRAAAELALSCLPHSHALNPNEIQRAILQCKEQSDEMLELACLTVEQAAKGGGVYPEVLFQVAKYWYELYLHHTPGGEQMIENEIPHDTILDPHSALVALIETGPTEILPLQTIQPTQNVATSVLAAAAANPVTVVTTPPPYQHPAATTLAPLGITIPYAVGHYNFLHPHPHHHHHPHHHVSYGGPIHPHAAVPMHHQPPPPPPPQMQMYQFQYPPPPPQTTVLPPNNQQFQPQQQTYPNLPPPQQSNSQQTNFTVTTNQQSQQYQLPSNPQQNYVTNQATYATIATNPQTVVQQPPNQIQPIRYYSTIPQQQQQQPPQSQPLPPPQQQQQQQPTQQPMLNNLRSPPNHLYALPITSTINTVQLPSSSSSSSSTSSNSGNGGNGGNNSNTNGGANGNLIVSTQIATSRPNNNRQSQFNQTQLRYLLAAYRVGMLALETLARRVHDDRPQAKYARNPPYGEDVKWLLRISKHLGTQYLHHFCVCAVNSIVSPFVLHDVAIEAAQYLSRNNPGLVMQHLRTALTPLVQKCQQMYIQCMHQKLYHLTSSDYEDFVTIVCAARAAFQITPDGSTQFKEWLQSIRRSKSCKKDLWTQINTALQANSK